MRKLAGYAGLVVGAVAVTMSVYHVYARLTVYAPDQQALLYLTLAFSLVLSFLLWPRSKDVTADRVPWEDLALAGLSLACIGYMFANYDYIVNRFPTADALTRMDMAVGITATLLVLEATRRTIGGTDPSLRTSPGDGDPGGSRPPVGAGPRPASGRATPPARPTWRW